MSGNAIRVLIALLLLVAGIRTTAERLHSGIDFYHFWAPAQARAIDDSLTSPYPQQDRYAAALNGRADELWRRFRVPPETIAQLNEALVSRTNTEQVGMFMNQLLQQLGPKKRQRLIEENRFLLANTRRREIDLTAPPSMYAALWFMPADYEAATHIWATLQFLLFLAGTVLIWRAAGGHPLDGAILAGAIMLGAVPFQTDVNVGNFNSVHLFFAALPCAAIAGPLRRASTPGTRALPGALALSLLALYVLLKPNFALLAVGLALHVMVTCGRSGTLRALVPTAIATAAILAWPCLYFDSWSVWGDWLAYIGSDADKLAYGVEKYNISFALHCTHWIGGPTLLWTAIAGLATLGSLIVVLEMSSAGESAVRRIRSGAMRCLRDPFAAATLGLVPTLAASPLIWIHYVLILIVPLGWLLARGSTTRTTASLTVIAMAIYAQLPITALVSPGGLDLGDLPRNLAALAWIPLWIATLARIRQLTAER